MPRRKQNYPKRLKCTSRGGTGSQQQTCDSGGDNSDVTSDEEGEEDEPMNSPESDNPPSPDAEHTDSEEHLKSPGNKSVQKGERSDNPSSMTHAEAAKSSFQENMDVTDSDISRPPKHSESPTSSPSVIASSPTSFVSKTENSSFQSTKTVSKSFSQTSSFSLYMETDGEQPLDLSKKTDKVKKKCSVSNGHSSSASVTAAFPSSLQSLQQRFGGDFPIEPPRRPSNSIPLQSTMVQGKSLLRSPLIVPSPNHGARISPTIDNQKPRPSPKVEKLGNMGTSPTKKVPRVTSTEMEHIDKNNKYTMHRCSCQKPFTTLYALSVHLQETGHMPGTAKAASLMDYPKLVRGQDMWLNQESEQTRRILRCMQCGESFKSLPMLTVHMMQTQHYTKIVSSDHGRRSHKCSAYCEKELDRECIFKCKVCHDTFTDMEGLANHMILSGHHKRQVLRTQNYPDLGMRARRKRYFSEESNSCGTPTVASLLEYKRKCISHSSNGFSPVSEVSGLGIESAISCENCGHKIEMHNFVEHVRSCLRQKSDVIGALKHKLSMDEGTRHRRFSGSSAHSPKSSYDNRRGLEIISPSKSSPSPPQSPNSISAVHELEPVNMDTKQDLHNVSKQDHRPEMIQKQHSVSESSEFNHPCTPEESDNPPDIDIKKEVDAESPKPKEKTPSPCPVKQERSSSVSPTKQLNVAASVEEQAEPRSPQKGEGGKQPESHSSLDIIDPNSSEPKKEGDSALKAMESFIQRSFSSKFDHHRSNMAHMMNPLTKSTLPLPGNSPVDADAAFNYFGKLRKFFNSFQPFESEMSAKKSFSSVSHLPQSEKSTKDSEKKRLQAEQPTRSDTKDTEKQKIKPPKLETNADDAKSPNKEMTDDDSEPLVNKYLSVEEGEPNKNGSALDSLSSFVYGQPMTSEHPLDSLQRLLTKTDIPKMLQHHFEPVSCRQLISPSDMSLPLNLSLKQSRSDDEDDDQFDDQDELAAAVRDGHSPSSGLDGELMEYKCAACSRQFASKGSYRYHLSRCHLSSVKKYGIKEAFNMSPYVYLPLDHTAKFTKYYEMAHELANKGK